MKTFLHITRNDNILNVCKMRKFGLDINSDLRINVKFFSAEHFAQFIYPFFLSMLKKKGDKTNITRSLASKKKKQTNDILPFAHDVLRE